MSEKRDAADYVCHAPIIYLLAVAKKWRRKWSYICLDRGSCSGRIIKRHKWDIQSFTLLHVL